jgi:MSHA biogenesis protein MshN
MSLINQMLSDLDKRHAADAEAGVNAGDVLAGVQVPAGFQRPATNRVWPLALLVAVALAGSFAGWKWLRGQGGHSTQAVAPAATVMPVMPPRAAQEPAPLAVSPATPAQQADAAPSLSGKKLSAVAPRPMPAPAAAPHTAPVAATPPSAAKAEQVAAAKPAAKALPPSTGVPSTAIAASSPAPKPLPEVVKQTTGDQPPQGGRATGSAGSARVGAFKVVSPQQQAENLHRSAMLYLQQSQVAQAKEALRQALGIDPANLAARELLAGLLLDERRFEGAARVAGNAPGAAGSSKLTMILARAQLAGGKQDEAFATLDKGLDTAGDDADYHAFFAALLQGRGRHEDAVRHYLVALRDDPAQPSWLVGIGISLQATGKLKDAAEAYQRALATDELTPTLAQYARQQLSLLGK